MDPADTLTLVRETCETVAAKAAHVTIDPHGEVARSCSGAMSAAASADLRPVGNQIPSGLPRGKHCSHVCRSEPPPRPLRAAVKSVAAGIGERELNVITTAGFDSGKGPATHLMPPASDCSHANGVFDAQHPSRFKHGRLFAYHSASQLSS